MKRLIPIASIALLFLATGCLKETIPTTSATDSMLVESDDALQGMLNGIPAQMVTPYFSYNGTRNSDDYDFSYPSEMVIMDIDVTRNNPRASVEDVYDLIFSDLDKAEEMLKGKVTDGKVFPDLAVVYGLKARAWLERGSAGV